MLDAYNSPWKKEIFKPLDEPGYICNIKKIIEAHEKIWEKPQFIHYTNHGKKHVEEIILSLNEWLKKYKFSAIEGSEESEKSFLFILLGAIYLHDIGMQCKDREFLLNYASIDLSDLDRMSPWAFLEKIRDNHQVLSYQMIIDSQKLIEEEREYPCDYFPLTILDLEREMNAIALLSASHTNIKQSNSFSNKLREEIKKMEKGFIEYSKYQIKPGVNINLRRLMFILRIGDALDATCRRLDCNRYNKEKVWDKLFSFSENELGLKFLFHILKHHFVDLVNIEVNNIITFKYEFPKNYEEDERLQNDLIAIAEYPLRRNLALYNRQSPLQPPDVKSGTPKFSSSKFDLLKTIGEKIPKDRNVSLRRLINIEAKRPSLGLIDSLEKAENKIWIIGQNLRFPADPSRATDNELDEDFFFNRIREKLIKNIEFEIWILIYNPLEEWKEIESWHNVLIQNWLQQSLDGRGEHKAYPPDFVNDLRFSFDRFKLWCSKLSDFRNRFFVKCITPNGGYGSRNIIDPDDDFGFVLITHRIENAEPDPRRAVEIFFDDQRKERNKYVELFEKATDIRNIDSVEWDKLSSYVIETDTVRKVCYSLIERDKIMKYLKEKITTLQTTLSRVTTDDKFFSQFSDKKNKLEEMFNRTKVSEKF